MPVPSCIAKSNCVEGRRDLKANLAGETKFLIHWEKDIARASAAAANRYALPAWQKDDLAQEARIRVLVAYRKGMGPHDGYIRRTIANAVSKAAQSEYSAAGIDHCAQVNELGNLPDVSADEFADRDLLSEITLAHWLPSLPRRFQKIYKHLYLNDRTQRSAAQAMDISQPRVAQLHCEFLDRGKRKFLRITA